jgi:sec-independent protein translocase protein TatC
MRLPFTRRKRATRPPDGQMTLLEHLAELRSRLMRSIIYVAVGFAACFVVFDPVMTFIAQPYLALGRERGLLTTDKLTFFAPTDAIALKLKVVTYLAIIVAMPLILWELWRFVSPGLTKQEKRWARPFVPAALFFFALGICVGYLTLPKALEFILGFAGENFQTLPDANKYLGFFTFMMLAFGLTFQFPIVLLLLQATNTLTWRSLLGGWRYAVVIIVAFAAIVTPSQDPYSLALLAGPMVVFYLGAIGLGYLLFRERSYRAATTASEGRSEGPAEATV